MSNGGTSMILGSEYHVHENRKSNDCNLAEASMERRSRGGGHPRQNSASSALKPAYLEIGSCTSDAYLWVVVLVSKEPTSFQTILSIRRHLGGIASSKIPLINLVTHATFSIHPPNFWKSIQY